MMKAISKKTPQKYFRDVLLNKHRKVLLEKDDAFFNSYVMDIESFPLSIQVFVKELTNISDIWKGLDSQNKEEIWKQLHTIIAASDKCDESNGCESIT